MTSRNLSQYCHIIFPTQTFKWKCYGNALEKKVKKWFFVEFANKNRFVTLYPILFTWLA